MEDGPGFSVNSTRSGGKAHTSFLRRVMPRTDKVTGRVSGAAPPTLRTPEIGFAPLSREIVSSGPVSVRLSISLLANNGLGPSAARTGFIQEGMENMAAASAIFRAKRITVLPVLEVAKIARRHAGLAAHRLSGNKRLCRHRRPIFRYQCKSVFRPGRVRFPRGWACDRRRFASRRKQIAVRSADLRLPAESPPASAPHVSRHWPMPAAAQARGTRVAPARHW